MRTRLILHIGMHKTGSSAIQRFLSRNRWVLGRMGVLYPHSIGPDGAHQPKHNALFAAISHEADHGAPHPVLGASADLVAETTADIEAASPRVAVLSAEGFSGERAIFANALRPFADRFDVRVVAFLRRRDLWVESFYKQMVQNREVREARPFHEFLAAASTRRHMDYARLLGWWAERFGDDALHVTPFETGAGEPVPLFLAAAGLSHRLALLPYARGAVNVSRSAEATEALRVANGAGLRPTKDLIFAIESAESQAVAAGCAMKEPAFLTDIERAEINAPFANDDAEIKRRFVRNTQDNGTLFSPATAPSRSTIWQGLPDDDPRLVPTRAARA